MRTRRPKRPAHLQPPHGGTPALSETVRSLASDSTARGRKTPHRHPPPTHPPSLPDPYDGLVTSRQAAELFDVTSTPSAVDRGAASAVIALAARTAMPRSVVWQTEERGPRKQPTKVPYNPLSGKKARADDSNTLGAENYVWDPDGDVWITRNPDYEDRGRDLVICQRGDYYCAEALPAVAPS
jgi:hypothetical protein